MHESPAVVRTTMGERSVHVAKDGFGLLLCIIKIDESIDTTHTAFYAWVGEFVSIWPWGVRLL